MGLVIEVYKITNGVEVLDRDKWFIVFLPKRSKGSM